MEENSRPRDSALKKKKKKEMGVSLIFLIYDVNEKKLHVSDSTHITTHCNLILHMCDFFFKFFFKCLKETIMTNLSHLIHIF